MNDELMAPSYFVIGDLTNESFREFCGKVGLNIASGNIDMSSFKKTLGDLLGFEPDYKQGGCEFFKRQCLLAIPEEGKPEQPITYASLFTENPLHFFYPSSSPRGSKKYDTYLRPTSEVPSKLVVVLPLQQGVDLSKIANKISSGMGVDVEYYGKMPVRNCPGPPC